VAAVPLRVASFNVRNGRAPDGRNAWPFRRRATAAAITDLGADLVGVQEAYGWQVRSMLRRLDGVDAVGRSRERRACRGERNPLLVASPRVQVLAQRTRWYGATPDAPGTRLPGARFPRIATIAWVEVDARAQVQVANTHLDAASPSCRAAAAEQLVGWLDPTVPGVILGDLNAGPEAPELRPLLDAGFAHALPDDAGGTFHRWTGATDGPRIDHVLVRGAIEVTAAEVAHARPDGRLPSDHWPVVADLLV
jgi:endonuclease/exonuclease/phosphatase family metal-dependent hydrolase